jgi:hypothetical protein
MEERARWLEAGTGHQLRPSVALPDMQNDALRVEELEHRLLRVTRFIENGFVARVRAVGVVYWSAFTSITACL